MARRELEVVDFTTSGNSTDLETHGFSVPEPHGTWTIGTKSGLRFPSPVSSINRSLRICGYPAIVQGDKFPKSQRLSCTVNGHCVLFEKELDDRFDIEIHLADAVLDGDVVEIGFHHPDALVPAALVPSGDIRQLAFNFWLLTLLGDDPTTLTTEGMDVEKPGGDDGIDIIAKSVPANEAEAPARDTQSPPAQDDPTPPEPAGVEEATAQAATSVPVSKTSPPKPAQSKGGWTSFLGW